MSVQKTSRQEALDKEAREQIAKIRRNGFNPPDELVEKAIRIVGPVRALVVMQLAASFDRSLCEVH